MPHKASGLIKPAALERTIQPNGEVEVPGSRVEVQVAATICTARLLDHLENAPFRRMRPLR
jgi:hypothetical protein